MTEPGRRERKKQQTRQSIADAALELFLARGFDDVGVKEVADRADVSVTTLFKHFPSKESLLFDEDAEMESSLVRAVRERPGGQSVPEALKQHFVGAARGHADHPLFASFVRLVESTPSLRAYQRSMWTRHETALAHAIAQDIGAPLDDVRCAGLARFALESRDVIFGRPDREQAAEALFGLLERGWAADQQT
ncbi:TetR/AcrR family transcriptional regulator [Lentzea sp. NBRC 102530]|uniref:TetR/AcrR family transcriptional regulator n=1 Tax=Lentzea sp. NBRC 102530 TaxID=3032201 RepID=UPI0024A415F5|nr:TetR/AcrR family transcriptional regulator [Lentzea sp. NBRC 102530]GLY48410.1 TetR family transcriptional regulator [Lentzea sp. NBRC 102530]